MYRYLLKLHNIPWIQELGVLRIRLVRPPTDIAVVELVLPIPEDGIEFHQPSSGQQPHRRDQACHASCGESAAREAGEEDLVAGLVVHGEEAIRLADMLRKPGAGDCVRSPPRSARSEGTCSSQEGLLASAEQMIGQTALGAHSGLVVNNLLHPIRGTVRQECPAESCNVGGDLKRAAGVPRKPRGPLEAAIAILLMFASGFSAKGLGVPEPAYHPRA
jgi:hypothetical protein